MAYYWQAQTIAGGHLSLSSPPCLSCFLVPFVVDYHGQRFGKYPPAWPVVLSLGLLLHAPYMVNSILAGLGVWLTYRLGKKILNEWVGFIAALLTLSSPFFLLNSASLLSHTWALVLSAAFAMSWLDTFNNLSRTILPAAFPDSRSEEISACPGGCSPFSTLDKLWPAANT